MNILSIDSPYFTPNSTSIQFEENIFNPKYIPPAFSLLQNNGSSLFTFILFSILMEPENTNDNTNESTKEDNESQIEITHEIDYSSDENRSFIEKLENNTYTFEELSSSSDKTTILITLLLGKLLVQELPFVQNQSKYLGNIILQPNVKISYQEIVNILSLGTHKWDADHPLLRKKKIALQKKEKKESLSLGLDANDESYASFCSNPEDEAFNAYMAKYYNFIPPKQVVNTGYGSNTFVDYNNSSSSQININPSNTINSSQSSSQISNPKYAPLFNDDQTIDRGNILYLLTFLILFFKFDHENASLIQLIEIWVQARKEFYNIQIGINDAVDDDLNFISDRSIQAASDYSLPFVEFLSDFQLISELGTYLPEVDIKSPFCVTDSLIYLKFREMLSDPKQTDNILEQFLILLKRPERNLLNLFTLLNFLLPQFILTKDNLEKIQEIMICAKQFLMEPLPIGGLANAILITCKRKLIYQGNIEREQLLHTLEKTTQTISVNGEEVPVFRRKRIYVLYNPDSQNSYKLKENLHLYENESEIKESIKLFNNSSSENEYANDITYAMANHVLNIFENTNLLDESLLSTPEEILSKYFYTLHELMIQFEKGLKQESRKHSLLKEIKLSILQDVSNELNKNSKRIVRNRYPNLPNPQLRIVRLPKEIELEKCKMERRVFPRSCMVDIIQDIVSEYENSIAFNNELNIPIAIAGGSGALQRFAHSLVVISRMQDKPKEYTIDFQVYLIPLGVNNHLSTWIEKHDPFYSRFWHNPITTPLTLGFGKEVKLKTQSFQTKERSRKSFFYNPVHAYRANKGTLQKIIKNTTSSDETSSEFNGFSDTTSETKSANNENESNDNINDNDYENQIENLDENLNENINQNENNNEIQNETEEINLSPKSLSNSNALITCNYFKNIFYSYVNEARSKLPVHIYTAQCLCYDVSKRDLRNQNASGVGQAVQRGNSVAEYVSLSFCQRLDIGIVAEAALQLLTNPDFSNLTMEEVISHKDFKFQGLNLSISYLPMDPSGLAPSSQISDRSSIYHSICVKSTSIPGDTGVLASPDQPWLEVLCEDVSTQKRRQKLREEDQSGYSYHVAQLIVDSATAAKFHILMDGELYGPYHKIIIALDNKIKNYNVMTYGKPRINR